MSHARVSIALVILIAGPLAISSPALSQGGPVQGASLRTMGLCLDISGAARAQGTPTITWGCHGNWNQRWTIGGGTIRSSHGLCLDIEGNTRTPGARVIVWPCNGQDNQRWIVQDGTIRSASGLCLDVAGGAREPGTGVIAWTCHGRENQQWSIQ